MSRKITCTSEDNVSLVFSDEFNPWLLEDCEGIYEAKNTVSTSVNTMTDGSTLQGSTAQMRNIILTLRDRPEADHQANRMLLYSLFKPKAPGNFRYEENGTVREIEYHVESVIIDSEKRSRRATVSLLCPNPFFTDLKDIDIQMAGWISAFEWQHMFRNHGEEFGYRTAERIRTITNESAADNIGITITIDVSGPASNPAITLVEQAESIEVGTTTNPLELNAGDRIIITTHTNNKHVYLEREGVREEINEYLSEESEFLQLMHGDNTFGYSAASGENYLTITISFRYRYLGV